MKPRLPFTHTLFIAARGVLEAIRWERNLKIQVAIAAIVLTTGSVVRLTRYEWIGIIVAIGLVMTVELLNTAIEQLVDLLQPEQDEIARKAKDFAAGGVLLAALASAAIGLLIFLPATYRFLQRSGFFE